MRDREIMGVDGLAKWLRVSPETVLGWVEQERIPFFRIGDFVGFRRKTLLRWFGQLERENPANLAHAAILFPSTARGDEYAKITEAFARLESDDAALRFAGALTLEEVARRSLTAAERLHALLVARIRSAADAWREQQRSDDSLPVPLALQELLDLAKRLDVGKIDLRDAFLPRAGFGEASLVGANFINASLRHADLRGANLEEATLSWADLRGARFGGANLTRAKLISANLQDAYLARACLRGANLDRARLAGANIEGADLRGANLSDVEGLTPEQLEVAVVDETTVLPAIFKATIRLDPDDPTLGERSEAGTLRLGSDDADDEGAGDR